MDEILAIPISLDSTYNMAICNECNIIVPYDWILGHLKGNHGIKVTLEEVATYLNIEEPMIIIIIIIIIICSYYPRGQILLV